MKTNHEPRRGRLRVLLGCIPLAAAAGLLACESNAELPVAPAALSGSKAGGQWSEWSEPTSVGEINTPAAETRAALSKAGLTLYFHSDRPGGFGSNDLWVARRDCLQCAWQGAVNLGSVVNGGTSESAPALSRDEHWLFFNSTRPGGHGGQDLWASYRANVHDDLAWGPPVNLGPGVNSAAGESQASHFENERGRAQLFFARNGRIHGSEMLENGRWGMAEVVPALAPFNGPSVHPNGLEIYVFDVFQNHRIWRATRESPDAPWSSPVELPELAPGVASVFHPFIHARGGTETLFVTGIPAAGEPADLYVTTRTR